MVAVQQRQRQQQQEANRLGCKAAQQEAKNGDFLICPNLKQHRGDRSADKKTVCVSEVRVPQFEYSK